jgi:hypothetical protein
MDKGLEYDDGEMKVFTDITLKPKNSNPRTGSLSIHLRVLDWHSIVLQYIKDDYRSPKHYLQRAGDSRLQSRDWGYKDGIIGVLHDREYRIEFGGVLWQCEYQLAGNSFDRADPGHRGQSRYGTLTFGDQDELVVNLWADIKGYTHAYRRYVFWDKS